MRTIFKYIFTPLPPVSFVERRWYERLSFYNRLNLFYRILFKNSFSYNSWKYNLLLVIKHFIVLILFPFYLPIILIFKIFNLKILHVDFAQIGAFIHQVDFLIKENKLNSKPQRLILLAPPILTVNKYLAKIFKKEIILSENFFYI